MRAAIWARVSTDEQETENQEAQLRATAGRRGWEVVDVYRVKASAYRGRHRHDLDQALDDGLAGRYDVLLIWALDRLSREGIEATLRELRRFTAARIVVVSLREPWLEELTGPTRELVLALFGWIAQQESAQRSERTKAGMERARAAGKTFGRPASKPVQDHRRWAETRDLVLAGKLSRKEAARRLHVRYGDLLAALPVPKRGSDLEPAVEFGKAS